MYTPANVLFKDCNVSEKKIISSILNWISNFEFALVVLLVSPWLAGTSMAQEFDSGCPDTANAAIWSSPREPRPGDSLDVLAVLTDGSADSLVVKDPFGEPVRVNTVRRGGPPWSLEARLDGIQGGAYRIEIQRGGRTVACRIIAVGRETEGVNEPQVNDWSRGAEAFYSAWIERLFDGPPETNLSFPSLEPVLRDPERNFLFNHLGRGEDERLPAEPDCADLPYFLRAYFAWKVGLPVEYRACDRGSAARPPSCGSPALDDRFSRGVQPASSFNSLMRQIANTVHSGSARTALSSDATDFYPVGLDRESLWPGTVFADPYGHTLMLAKWIPQTPGHSGILLAVDAQPDNSVARKRFWEGNFLFADVKGAGPGFKAFRPVLRDSGGRLRLPSNSALSVEAPLAPYSDEQAGMSADDFYARMGKLIDPKGLPPEQAYESTLDALVEQLNTRVESVENGENYMRQHRGSVIAMPSGAGIFETIGPWEDYATPSRDMRLLIALNVLSGLPDKIVRYPDLFALRQYSPESAKRYIEELHQRKIQERRFSYMRSDGSAQELTVADVFQRRSAFEAGYNPNDCAEVRWGAKSGTDEYVTCRRRAPAEQRLKMEQYRNWFHDTRRPTR